MGVTVTSPRDISTRKIVFATVAFDSSYPTGGEAVTAANFGLASLAEVIPIGAPGGYLVEFVRSTSKLKVYTATNAQSLTGDAQEVAAAAAAEIGNTTDLSALTVQVLAVGN